MPNVGNFEKPGSAAHIRGRHNKAREKLQQTEVEELKLMQLPHRKRQANKQVEKSESYAQKTEMRRQSQFGEKLVADVGALSLTQAVKRLRGRYGRGVKSESLSQEYELGDEATKKAIEDEIERIGVLRGRITSGESIRENPNVLKRRDDILHALRDAGHRKLTPAELTAVLAYRYGLSPYENMSDCKPVKSEFLENMNATESLPYGPNGVISGPMVNCINAVRKGMLNDMHELLWHPGTGDVVFSSDEIIKRLNVYERFGWDCKSRRDQDKASGLVSHSGGILESMGLIRKLPRRAGASKNLRWVHSGYFESTYLPPEEAIDYDILTQLKKRGPTPLQDFAKQYRIGDNIQGSPKGRYPINTLRMAVDRMETEGLIEREKRGKTYYVDLRREGRDLIERQQLHDTVANASGEVPNMLEDTRRVILGSYAEGLSAEEKKTLRNLVEAVTVVRYMQEGKTAADAANDLGCPKSRDRKKYDHWYNLAYSCSRGIYPWRRISEENMIQKYLPKIREMQEDGLVCGGISEWLVEEVLKKQGGKTVT
jgi:DNA-binding MarR family transcriptional regulator